MTVPPDGRHPLYPTTPAGRPDFSQPPPQNYWRPPVPPPPTTYIQQAPPLPPDVPPPSNRGKIVGLVVGAGVVVGGVVVLILALTGVFSGAPHHQLTITVSLQDSESTCLEPAAGYDDFHAGMPVTVRDENNKVIASTSLPAVGHDEQPGCTWTMNVDVPTDVQQYQIESGRRGVVTFPKDEVVTDNWTAELSIGH